MNTPQSHRDTELESINPITARIIGCAIEVHKVLGPGLLESIYEKAMDVELDEAQIEHKRQVSIPAHYKGRLLGQYRVDLIVQDLVLVEIKSVERPLPVFDAQLLTYMRVLDKRVGLLINFSRLVTEGITRLAL
jgi:GxxExxY protein